MKYTESRTNTPNENNNENENENGNDNDEGTTTTNNTNKNSNTNDASDRDEKSNTDEKENSNTTKGDTNGNNNNNNNTNKRKRPRITNIETTSLMQDIFGGQVVSEVECCVCGNKSTTKDVIYDLSVEIPKPEQIDKAVKERDAQPLPQRGWVASMLGFVGLSNQSV